jgi:nitrogen regulation protein NR(I)
MKKTHVLLIEDDVREASSLERLLQTEGYQVTLAHRGDEGLQRALQEDFDVVVTDLRLPGVDGLEVVRRLHAAKPRLPIVLMTAYGTTDNTIEATKHGAFEYLSKPFKMDEFLALTARAATSARLMREPVELGETTTDKDALIGASRLMQNVYKEIGRVAAAKVSVLIRGETGTGKELVARAIYQHSDRAGKPFIAVNCAAIPETLLESELFGHEKGAFTGAETRRVGRFEQAHEGTLFLDEIGDMSLLTQAKLLRVLQEKTIQRVGGKHDLPVDVRILAATHRDLEAAIQKQQFREDLYYRLAGVVIHLPPLRERGEEDIARLVKYFVGRHGRELGVAAPAIEPAAITFLQTQPWPGNVRQLSNYLRQALLLASGFPVGLEHVQAALASTVPSQRPATASFHRQVEELLQAARREERADVHARVLEAAEQILFSRALELSGGNQAKAARWLGVARQTVREKWLHFGLRPPEPTEEQPDDPAS